MTPSCTHARFRPNEYAHVGPSGHAFVQGLLTPVGRSASPDAIVVEVGPNRGVVTRVLARAFPKAQLHLFECLSEHVSFLRTSWAADARVVVTHAAVGDVAGQIVPIKGPPPDWMAAAQRRTTLQTAGVLGGPYFPASGKLGAGAKILNRANVRWDGHHVLERVATTTLDARYLAHPSTNISFLKIDAEGLDGRVLRGAAGLLAQRRVSAVYWESFPQQQALINDSLATDVAFLRSLGYRSYLVGKKCLLPLTGDCDASDVFRQRHVTNAVAFADEQIERRALGTYCSDKP